MKRKMEELGITQREIAKKAKVTPAAISLIVNGKSKSQRIEQMIQEEIKKRQ
jgi:transcriptional regulator with XRE-family HTH domain